VPIHRLFFLLVLSIALPFAHAAEADINKIDINKADVWLLDYALYGVGPKKAAAIIEYREKHGPFQSIHELSKVYGIGEKTIEKNMEKMFVSPPEESEQPEADAQIEQSSEENDSEEVSNTQSTTNMP